MTLKQHFQAKAKHHDGLAKEHDAAVSDHNKLAAIHKMAGRTQEAECHKGLAKSEANKAAHHRGLVEHYQKMAASPLASGGSFAGREMSPDSHSGSEKAIKFPSSKELFGLKTDCTFGKGKDGGISGGL